jgi:hypothetical protein
MWKSSMVQCSTNKENRHFMVTRYHMNNRIPNVRRENR